MTLLDSKENTTHNTGLAKVAVQCSADPPRRMVNQSLVLRINICGENRQLRQARKRYFKSKVKEQQTPIIK